MDEEDLHNRTETWNVLRELRKEGKLCDGVLVCGFKESECRYPVHRPVLAACSPYFRALFTSSFSAEEKSEIFLADVPGDLLRIIVDFAYSADVCITSANVERLLPLADLYCIQGLVTKCADFLIAELSTQNCIGIVDFARTYNSRRLEKEGMKFILKNFWSILTNSHELMDMDFPEFVRLLDTDELNVRSEEQVWLALCSWISYREEERLPHLLDLLKTVRLGFINLDSFEDTVANHRYIKNNNTCSVLIERARSFLRDLDSNQNVDVDFADPLVRPRVPHDVLFALGGWSGGSPICFFESYDTRADRWYTHAFHENSIPRAYHGLVSLDGILYVIGGYDGAQYFNNVTTFDPLTKLWKNIAPMYFQRCYVATTVLNGSVYACGGYDGRQRLASAERYDPSINQWEKIAEMCSRRSDAGMDAYNGVIYICGGFDGDQCLNTCETYNPLTNQWTILNQMVFRRSGVSILAYAGDIYALGGFDGEQRLRTVERYNPETRRWSTVKEMNSYRSNFAGVVLDDMIFVMGGFDGRHTIQHVECYDSVTDEWMDATDMNVNRSALSACVVRDLENVKDYTYYGHDICSLLEGDSENVKPPSELQ